MGTAISNARADWTPDADPSDATCVICERRAVVQRSAWMWCRQHSQPTRQPVTSESASSADGSWHSETTESAAAEGTPIGGRWRA